MRYEHAGKFWTITRVGSVVTQVAGKIGNKGRTTTQHHPNEVAARAAHDQLVLEKQRAGYRIAAAEDAAGAEDAPGGPGVDAAPPPADDDRAAALEAAIVDDPDDAQAYAVYGDWLQRHGDPRGELIALLQAPGPKAAAIAGKHIAQHAGRLLGPLAALVPDLRIPEARPFFWKHGFIRRAELASGAGQPLDETVRQLLAHPSATFLVELVVRAADRGEALAILDRVKDSAPATLREFDLFARAHLGRIDATFGTLPRLERVGLTARSFELAGLDVPSAKRARFLASSMTASAVEAIARAPWPILERLEIRFCAPLGSTEADFLDVRPLVLRDDMPRLTHLRLRGCAFAGAIVRALAVAPLARQLEVLDLSGGAFTPHDIQQLAAAAGNFPALRELWVPYNYVTPQIEQQLAAVAKRVIPDSKGVADKLDAELAGEAVPRGGA